MGSQPPVIILDHFSFTLVSLVGRGSFPTERGSVKSRLKEERHETHGTLSAKCQVPRDSLGFFVGSMAFHGVLGVPWGSSGFFGFLFGFLVGSLGFLCIPMICMSMVYIF